jgi:uncharacterized protein (DUF2147 family)
MRIRIVKPAIAVYLLACVLVGSAVASPITGTWQIRDLVLNVFKCPSGVCGRIAWLENRSQRRSLCNRRIVWGLAARGSNRWDGGSIIDPDDSYIYHLSAVLQRDGTLRARIFEGEPVFGQTEILRRVSLRSFAGIC